MGEFLDFIAVTLFLILSVFRSSIVSRRLNFQSSAPRLLLASTLSLLGTLATALAIVVATGGTIIMGISIEMIGPRWPLAVLLLAAVLVISATPGYFIERRILVKGGMSADAASKTSRYSSLFLLVNVAVLILVCYVIAMHFF